MTNNIKFFTTSIFIGLGAISSGFASDSESDERDDRQASSPKAVERVLRNDQNSFFEAIARSITRAQAYLAEDADLNFRHNLATMGSGGGGNGGGKPPELFDIEKPLHMDQPNLGENHYEPPCRSRVAETNFFQNLYVTDMTGCYSFPMPDFSRDRENFDQIREIDQMREKRKLALEEKMCIENQGCLPNVPTDMVGYILMFLSPEDYEAAGSVCKRFYRITRNIALLPAHLNGNIRADSYLSLNKNILVDLGAILANTIGNEDERKIRMDSFEEVHLPEIKAAFRVLKFYHQVLELDSICPGDEKLPPASLSGPYKFKSLIFKYLSSSNNKFISQNILKKSNFLIDVILSKMNRVVNIERFPFIKSHLEICEKDLPALIKATQIDIFRELMDFHLQAHPFVLPPAVPGALAAFVPGGNNNNNANPHNAA